jgi:hypothetical protein
MNGFLRRLLRSRGLILLGAFAWLMLVASAQPVVSGAMMDMAPSPDAQPAMTMAMATAHHPHQARIAGDPPGMASVSPLQAPICTHAHAGNCNGMSGHACHCAAMSGNGLLPGALGTVAPNALRIGYQRAPVRSLASLRLSPPLRPPLA